MENFYLRNRQLLKFSRSTSLYSTDCWIDQNVLFFREDRIPLPFNAVYLQSLAYDIFLISDDQNLYRINKHVKEIENFGCLIDRIYAVGCEKDKVIVVTDKEILYFNAYFDLTKNKNIGCPVLNFEDSGENKVNSSEAKDKSITESFGNFSLQSPRFNSLIFGDGIFAVIFPKAMHIFNLDLELVSSVSQKVKSAVYIAKYNKFACAIGSTIMFIEPNGLEHGDPLMAEASVLMKLAVDGAEILLCCNNGTVSGYFMKNFFWYNKFTVSGKLFGTEDNAILILQGHSIFKYYVYRETSENFVIDGLNLYYTNLGRACIPPPFYYKQIKVDAQIKGFYYDQNLLFIMSEKAIEKLSIDGNDMIHHLNCISYKYSDDVAGILVFNSSILINRGEYVEIIGEKFPEIENFINKIEEVQNAYKNSDSATVLNIIKLFKHKDSLGCLFSNGIVFYGHVFAFNFDIGMSFSLQSDDSKIYFLNSGILQRADIPKDERTDERINENIDERMDENIDESVVSPIMGKTDISGVYSFLLYRNYLIYITKDLLTVLDLSTGDKFDSFADDNTDILCLKDNKIILYTRFGTLESVTNKLFSMVLVRSFIQKGDFSIAAELCDYNHVDFSIFFEKKGFDVKNLSSFSDSHALSLFQAMNIHISSCCLENEYFERLDYNFDPSCVLKNSEFVPRPTNFIALDSVLHIFENINRIPVKISADTLFAEKNSDQVKFLRQEYTALDELITTNSLPITIINSFLKNLTLTQHFSTIINILIAINRMDLCFYISNVQKVVKLLLTKISPELIAKESIRTMNIDTIVTVQKLCQRDSASFLAFYNSCSNVEFSLSEYLEDRRSALFYLVKSKMPSSEDASSSMFPQEIIDYAAKYNMFDALIMYSYFHIFDFCFYPLVAKFEEPLDQFYLFLNSGDTLNALATAKNNLFWQEALNIDSSEDNCRVFIDLLTGKSRFAEAGEIYNDYLNDHVNSISYFLKGKKIAKAFSVFKSCSSDDVKSMESLIKKFCVGFLKSDLIVLNELKGAYEKYKSRLQTVRDRLNENLNDSQTSFSHSSHKSSERALTKDRPGGIYENEFVMNKIRDVVLRIIGLREEDEEFLEVFRHFDENDMIDAYNESFGPLKTSLKTEIDFLWDYARTDCDIELPKVPKPEVSEYFD